MFSRQKTVRGRRFVWLTLLAVLTAGHVFAGEEAVWLEAEHLTGIKGYCWPMGRPNMKKTNGNWGLSGPGWAAEWAQGGESGFLSIATGADDDKAVAHTTVEIPVAGKYFVWVRYGDWRERTERFQIRIEQDGTQPWTGRYGEAPVVDEDNIMKLYWGWAFGWGGRSAQLQKGPAKLQLLSTTKDPEPRQVDVVVLTTDASYRPMIKERPADYAWQVLESYRQGISPDLEPLARTRPAFKLPEKWKTRTFKDRGFLYLWNVSKTGDTADWLGADPNRVLYPYNVRDAKTIAAFKKKYGGQKDVPIFSDPRIVPAFHGAGPGIFCTDPNTGEVKEEGKLFAKWLDQDPNRLWGMMMNYHPDNAIGPKGIELFQKYRDRYVGSISGESLGYFYPDAKAMKDATTGAKTRRQLVEAFTPLTVGGNAAKYRKIFGKDLDKNPYEDVISCLSVGNIVFAPLLAEWETRTLGYESAVMTSSVLGMRWAFMRGLARQRGRLTATYRSCNFGDSATMFSETGTFSKPANIYDNYYSVYSGAGMTWYKMDIWYQYMAGSSIFYHEQGFDEYWMPGGTTAAGRRDIELSPKGKLVDRFLRVTAREPDRGYPYTPVAFLIDYAHGWEPAPYWPNSFKNWHGNQESFLRSDHERMLEAYLWTAYYPIGPESEKPIGGVNEVYLPGVYGDIFDVICAYPDAEKWQTIDTYPVVIATGEIELTDAEGKRLARYIQQGGTLVVADAHLTGPGLKQLRLPATEAAAEADSYRWMQDEKSHPSARFRYRPIRAGGQDKILATADDKPFCVASDRGKGRLIYISVGHGLCISKQTMPIVPRLLAHLTRGLMPVEVDGDVKWLVSRTENLWLVTLLNPAGQNKPQQGIVPTDYRENRKITIRCNVPVTSARDRLLPTDKFEVVNNAVRCEVLAGSVRIMELR